MSAYIVRREHENSNDLKILEVIHKRDCNPRSGAAMAKLERWGRQFGFENIQLMEEIPVKYHVDIDLIEEM